MTRASSSTDHVVLSLTTWFCHNTHASSTDHVVLSTDDVADFDVRHSRHDAVARLVNEDHDSTRPSLAVEAEL